MKNYFLVFVIGLFSFLLFGMKTANACENQPKLEIENKGEIDEKWVLSVDLSDPSCDSVKKFTWSYDLWNYQGQALQTIKEKEMNDGEGITLNHGDLVTITASMFSKITSTSSSESGNPCSNLPPGVLGCSTDGGKTFYSYTNKSERDSYGGDSYDELTNTYTYQFMPYSDFPLEATVECNKTTPSVHLYWIDFETRARRVSSSSTADGVTRNDSLLSHVLASSDGSSAYDFRIYRGNGEQYEAENCRDNLPYHCVQSSVDSTPIYQRNNDWDYENPEGTLAKYGYDEFLDNAVVNNQYYHYFASYSGSSGSYDYLNADSNNLTVYVNCPNM